MHKTMEAKLTDSETTRIEAAVAKCDEALIQVFKEMKKDQAEIEKLRVQTRAILADLRTA